MNQKNKAIKNTLLTVLIIIGTLVFVVCAYFLYQELAVYSKATKEYTSFADQAITVPEGSDKDNPLSRVVDFDTLQKTNSDIVGWLYIPGTVVDYPVVKTGDNEKYLDTLFSGEKNKAGAIFMDYRNKPGFTDDNTILYGHNMKNKSMFHVLVEYSNQDFYNDHKNIYYYTLDGAYELRIFSVFKANASDMYTSVSFGKSKEADLKALAARTLVLTDEKIDGEKNIATLSTCSYEFDDARFVVQATVNKMPYGGAK